MTPINQALLTALQCYQAGQNAEAEGICRQVIGVEPANTDALGLLAVVVQALGRLNEAISTFQEVLRQNPNSHLVMNNLGHALVEAGRIEEAEAVLQKALALAPKFPHALVNLGNVLKKQGRAEESMACFERALDLEPNLAEAMINLGNAHLRLNQLTEAATLHRRAMALKPHSPGAYFGLAGALRGEGKYAEALATYQEVFRFKPDYPEAHMNVGLTLLLLGDFERGWPSYEWRHKCREYAPGRFGRPLWDGSPLAGRTILLHAEQGFGDALQFIRYAPLVKERGGKVLVECQPSLARLLATCSGVDGIVRRREPFPPFDVEAPLLSLPTVLHTTLATIPASVPYLFPEEKLIEQRRAELKVTKELKVGIVWQGNPQNLGDRSRSIPLARFAALSDLEGVRLFSLQRGAGREHLAELENPGAVMDLADKSSDDFMETAAMFKAIDLVISVDTAAAHLAGAVGVPVWLALPSTPDWRWMLDREDSPWYPTMRLFRQRRRGDWEEVFVRLREALAIHSREHHDRARPI